MALQSDVSPRWQQLIWVGAGSALFLTIACLVALVGWTVVSTIEIIGSVGKEDTSFLLSGMSIITLTLLRFLSVLIGGTICFAGIAVSFFASKNANSLNIGAGGEGDLQQLPKVALATYSPGLIGVVVGALVIVAALYAKSTHTFPPPVALYQNLISQPNGNVLPSPDKLEEAVK